MLTKEIVIGDNTNVYIVVAIVAVVAAVILAGYMFKR